MSLTVGELQVLLSGDTRSIDRSIDGLDSRAGKTESIWSGAFKRIAITGGVALAGLGVGAFLKDTASLGIEYTNQLNTLQAVSGATAQQMLDVGKTAKVLGADLTLPATSAADAAAVMTELAKAGFSVADAQTAAKGSLQLAAAAQIDGAKAAEIQANALLAFHLQASDAGHVADVLANSANASSAEITDMSDALAQAGAVAAGANISIEDTAAALGILANNGIKGADAGTLVKSFLLALRNQSKPAQAAIEDLGLSVYDANGNFVGLSQTFGELSAAQKSMSQESFEAATNVLFGSDASRLAGIAASSGAEGFDTMRAAMSKSGAAADVAAAKSKGLGGAIEGFKSQVETFQIDLFERASPNIEKLVRYAAAEFPKVGDAIFDGIDKGVEVIGDLKDTAVDAFQAVAHYIEPVTSQLDDLYTSLSATHGPLDAVWGGLKLTGAALVGVANALHPVVQLGGAVLGFFNALPGPIQTVVLGLAALKIATSLDLFGKLAGKDNALGGITRGLGTAGSSVMGFTQTITTNMKLARQAADDGDEAFRAMGFGAVDAGQKVGTLSAAAGGVSAAFQSYMPKTAEAVTSSMGNIRRAFAEAKEESRWDIAGQFGMMRSELGKSAGDLAGFRGALTQTAKEGIGGLRAGAGGLVSFMGGPWGVALAGGAAAIGFFASQAAESKTRVDQMAQSMLDGTAAIEQLRAASEAKQDRGLGQQILDGLTLKPLWSDDYYSKEFDQATAKAKELYDAMTPLQQKQQDVTNATHDLEAAIAQFGPTSGQAAGAAAGLRDAQDALKGAQDGVTEATKTEIDKLNELANLQLASVNSALAAQQSQFAFADQLAATNQVIAEQGAGSDAASRSLVDLAQQAISNAQAQGKAAADQAAANGVTDTATVANQAMLQSLQATAQQMGSNTPAAITQLIGSLQASAGTAATTAARMDDLNLSVRSIPGSKDVIVNAPTADQTKRLQDLGYTVTNIPGSKDVRVTANTDEAAAAISRLVNGNYTVNVKTIYSNPGAVGVGRLGSPVGNALGNILSAGHGFAVGGFAGARPFDPSLAQVFPPGQIRYAGDRIRDDEAFIPINQDARSLALLSSTARRMGGQFVPLGAVGTSATGTGSGSVTNRNYSYQAVVREEISPERFMALQRQVEAIYG